MKANGIEQTVQGYFAGWNAHDAKFIAGLLAPDAIHEDPTTRMTGRSYDLATVVSSVAKVPPDVRFEVVSVLPGYRHGGYRMDFVWHQQ